MGAHAMTPDAREPGTGAAAQARASVALNPVAVTWAVSMGVTLASTYGLKLDRVQAGAVSAIACGLVAVVTAASARPWYIPGITGGVASALTAAAAFGLKLDADQIAAASAGLQAVLMLTTHAAVIPATANKLGMTARDIQLNRALGGGPPAGPPPPGFIPGPGPDPPVTGP